MKLIGFILTNWPWFLGGLVLLIAAEVGLYQYAYHEGKTNCTTAQAVAQVKQKDKTAKDYRNVDRQTPTGADRATQLNWLRRHVVRE